MAKQAKTFRKPKSTKRVLQVGQAVRVATDYDGTVFAEIIEIDRQVFVVKTADGKVYRVLAANIV